MTRLLPAARTTVLVVLVVGLAACTLEEAVPTEEPSATVVPTALGSEPPDPRAAALTVALEELRTTVAAARDALEGAQTGSAADASRAVALLVADEPLSEEASAPEVPPLFPGGDGSREETIDYGDAFSRTLNEARGAGAAGAEVVDLLRDPVAGDVGTWQRDAGGMLALVRRAATRTSDLDAAEATVAELPGEGTKALAWALLADTARSDELRAAFAERGIAHLDLVLAAIDDLVAPTPDAGA